jgi:hypothetical protein
MFHDKEFCHRFFASYVWGGVGRREGGEQERKEVLVEA